MRLTIDHHTRYQFSEPQARVVQLLRMTPADCRGQTVTDWRIDINCDARLRDGIDGYGNLTTMLYIDGPIEMIELMVRGEVLTDDSGGRVEGCAETLPPLFYLRSTPLTQADDAISQLAADIAGRDGHRLEQASTLMTAVHDLISPVPGRTDRSVTAAEALARGQGSVRDCAHVLIAAARAVGIPARLVTGHCLDGPNAASHSSAHCWAELFIEGDGWVSVDPSTNRRPLDSYVRVAIGLDASDSTPLSGTRRGGGVEVLDVDVRVAESQSQE